MIYIAICDDHKTQVENIKTCIQKLNLNKEVELCTFTNEEEMIQTCIKINRNFIFILDIVLQDNVSGIDIAKKINELFPKSVIIFISSYLEKVTDIFEVEQCYFIYKPEMEKRLQDALEKAISIYDTRSLTLSFKVGSETKIVPLSDIYSIERIKRYSLVKCKDHVYRILDDFENLMPKLNSYFCQCHQCYIVNFMNVKEFSKKEFILTDQSYVPISRSRLKETEHSFQMYLRGL